LDTVTFTPTTATASTKAFYRLATAAGFTSTDANSTFATGETSARLVEWDGTNNDFIIEVWGIDLSNIVKHYMQYTFDSNDQFATEGIVTSTIYANGTAATMANWELAMGAESLTAGAVNDIVHIAYAATGISTDINRFTMDAG